MPKIGLMISATDANDVWHDYIQTFQGAITTPGVIYDAKPLHGAGGVDYATYKAAAQQLITGGANVIVTAGNLAAKACKDAAYPPPPNPPIPNPPAIVVASAGDLTGLADQNLTGFTNGQNDLWILDERIARMLRILAPQQAVAVVGNDTVGPVQKAMNYAVGSLTRMGVVPVYWASFTQATHFQNKATIRGRLNPVGKPAADVLLVCSDPLMRTHGHDFIAAVHGTPPDLHMKTMHEFAEWNIKHGGELFYGPNFTTLFQKAAGYVDQILANTPVANLPVVPVTLADCVQTPPPPP
jgi:hypothetical protein